MGFVKWEIGYSKYDVGLIYVNNYLVKCDDTLNVYVLSLDMEICWFIGKLWNQFKIGMILWEGLSLFKKGPCHLLSS